MHQTALTEKASIGAEAAEAAPPPPLALVFVWRPPCLSLLLLRRPPRPRWTIRGAGRRLDSISRRRRRRRSRSRSRASAGRLSRMRFRPKGTEGEGRGEVGLKRERVVVAAAVAVARCKFLLPFLSTAERASEDEAVAFNRHASGAQPRLSRSRNLAARARRLSLTLWWRETSVLHVDRSGDKWRRCRRGLLLLLLSLDQR